MKIRFETPPRAGQDVSGLAVRYAAAKRQVPRWRWYLLLALVLALPAYFALRFVQGLIFVRIPATVVFDQSVVRVPQAGVVEYVPSPGQTLPAGAPVLQMQAPQVIEPSPPNTLPRPTTMGKAREDSLLEAVALAERQWRMRRERLARIEYLLAQDAATRPELEAAQAQLLQAEADLNRARGELAEHREVRTQQVRTTPPAPPSPQPPKAAVAHAPFPAQVARVYVYKGEWQPQGTEAVLLQAVGSAHVQAYLDPRMARRAQPGRRVVLHFPDGHEATAEVVELAPQVERLPPDRVSPLEARTTSLLVRLRPLEPLAPRYRIHGLPLDVRFKDW